MHAAPGWIQLESNIPLVELRKYGCDAPWSPRDITLNPPTTE